MSHRRFITAGLAALLLLGAAVPASAVLSGENGRIVMVTLVPATVAMTGRDGAAQAE